MPKYISILLTALLALGCSTSSEPTDSGTDIPVVPDSGEVDAESDSGEVDAAEDPGLTDAETDVAADVDCSTIGCAMAPMCGSECTAVCGCCDCGRESFCREDGFLVSCNDGCYEQTECGDAGCNVDDATGVASCGSCDTLRAQYEALTAGTALRCEAAGTCHVLSGHCGVGLGGCHYGVNTGVTQAQLDSVAADWVALGCDAGAPVCRCTAPPPVRCDAGGCLLGG